MLMGRGSNSPSVHAGGDQAELLDELHLAASQRKPQPTTDGWQRSDPKSSLSDQAETHRTGSGCTVVMPSITLVVKCTLTRQRKRSTLATVLGTECLRTANLNGCCGYLQRV